MNALEFFKQKANAYISPMGVKELSGGSPGRLQILDVRIGPVPQRIPGSIAIPVNEISSRMTELDPERLVVIYCWDTWCSLATKAAIELLEAGFQAKELYGGVAAWQAMSFEMETVGDDSASVPRCEC